MRAEKLLTPMRTASLAVIIFVAVGLAGCNLDACGKPQTAVISALQALPFRVTQAARAAPIG